MADPNTCEQCGVSNHNRPSVVIRQSGKGKLVCQACYDIINPEEQPREEIKKEEVKKPAVVFLEDVIRKEKEREKYESISSSKTQKEERTVRNSSKRLQR